MTATPPNEMPYKRGSGCDLCGEPGPLRRVVLKKSSGSSAVMGKDGVLRPGTYKAARVVYVCGHHLDSDPAFEPRAPRSTFAPGISRQEPQKERLW